MTNQEIENRIAFILSNKYCVEIVDSPDPMIVCEGDCIPCRTAKIVDLIKVIRAKKAKVL